MPITIDGRTYPIEVNFEQGVDVWYGGTVTTIYSQARLDGYQAGLRVYAECEACEERGETSEVPADLLTDLEFMTVLDTHLPCDLTRLDAHSLSWQAGYDVEVWRASFIAGWTCAALEIDSWDPRPAQESTESVFGPRHTLTHLHQRLQPQHIARKQKSLMRS